MTVALWLLAALGVIGAFDTLYYHEWRARLPARGAAFAAELRLHAARDFFYAAIFGTLPWLAWQGAWVLVFAAILGIEILLTMWDFIVESVVRKPIGDVYAGERVTHNFIGIIYGAMIAVITPTLWRWKALPTALAPVDYDVPPFLVMGLLVMAVGVFVSGLRDLYASLGFPGGNWPWPKENVESGASAEN
ncbi:MAG: hypothetical protein ACKVX7_11140 [Planctomycetota bacterium]